LRYFFHTSFDGHLYRGWQRQANADSVQEVVETVLGEMLKEPVSIMGCGRTDAQVHASQFFFHLDIKDAWDYDLLFRINKMLPDNIAIFEIIPVKDNQHARFDATQRRYDYFIHTYKDPHLNHFSSWYPEKNLHFERMKKAVALLTRYDDFRAFCKSPDTYLHTICKVSSAILFTDEKGERLRFQISADRFLGRMVRLIVGKLLQVGKGELSLDEFESYLITKTTPKVLDVAYPQGLFLSKVSYPYLDIPTRTAFSNIGHSENQWLTL
jgi:tRNA pseudouridine38-40 synthase